jgi:murein DD-endopeptidase MepM/ murein hydrolase activator NlpD
MEKKVKFSDQPMRVKIIYSIVVAVLCISAIVIGTLSVANKKDETQTPITPPASDGSSEENGGGGADNTPQKPEKVVYNMPASGEIVKSHSLDTPVFSATLGDWRIHKGIDISCEVGTEVYSVAKGEVSAIYKDPFLGRTVEITHEGGVKSVYSNLKNEEVAVNVGDKIDGGTLIGVVGDTSLTELADESHLHFEMKLNDVSVNPLDYISQKSEGGTAA